jgi:hypothetical protein
MARPVRGLHSRRSKTMTETVELITVAGITTLSLLAIGFAMGYYIALRAHIRDVYSMQSLIAHQRDAIQRIADLPERSRQGRTIARQALTTWRLKGEIDE